MRSFSGALGVTSPFIFESNESRIRHRIGYPRFFFLFLGSSRNNYRIFASAVKIIRSKNTFASKRRILCNLHGFSSDVSRKRQAKRTVLIIDV